LFVAVLIGAGMVVLTRQGGERRVQSPDRSAARGTPAAARPPEAILAPESASNGDGAPRARVDGLAPADDPGARRIAAGPGPVFVTGAVELPAERPGVDGVFAVLRGRRALPASADPGERMLRGFSLDVPPEVGRVPLGADLRFRIEVPAGLEDAAVVVDGPGLRTAEAGGIADGTAPGDVRVRAELAAGVRVRLVPSPGLAHDPQKLVGRSVSLEHIPRGKAWMGAPWSENARITADLTATFDELPQDQDCDLWWEIPPFAPIQASGVQSIAGEVVEVVAALRDGVAIEGVVVDEGGEPVPRASVQGRLEYERASGGNGTRYFYATSDDAGRFAFDAASPGVAGLQVSADGFLPATLERAELEAAGFTGVRAVLSRGDLISGVVRLPGGRAVANAKVQLVEGGRSFGGPETTTDATGRFVFSGLTPGERRVTASASFAEPPAGAAGVAEALLRAWREPVWFGAIDGVRPGMLGLELHLAPPAVLRGRVVDDRGAPVGAFTLRVAPQDVETEDLRRFSTFGEQRRDFEQAGGSFALEGLAARRCVVRAEADEHADSAPAVVDLSDPAAGAGSAVPLELVLPRAASLEGRVVDPDGAPAAGATVEPTVMEGGRLTKRWNDRTTADADGRFALAGLAPGPIELVATAGGFAPSEVVVLEVAPGETRAVVVLALRLPGAIGVRALHADGSPRKGQEIGARAVAGGTWGEGSTDSAGRATIDGLAPGRYEVAFRSEGAEPESDAEIVDVVAGATVDVVLGAPRATALRVRGRVTVGGAPLSGAAVWLREPGEAGAREKRVETDDDGRFVAELELGSDVTVLVHPPGGRSRRFDERMPASGDVQIAYDLPAGGMRGTVTADGELGGWLLVHARPSGAAPSWRAGAAAWTRVRKDGAWSLLNLDAGAYDVVVAPEPFFTHSAANGAAALRRDVAVATGAVTDVDLHLSAGATIAGGLTDMTGAALREPSVTAWTPEGIPLLTTDVRNVADGRYALHGLPAGEVVVTASAAGRALPKPARVVLRGRESTRLDLVLEPATSLVVTLDGLTATELGAARVSLRDAAGIEHARADASRGERYAVVNAPAATRAFGPLAPGEYALVVTSPDGRIARASVRLAGEPSRAVALSIP
jgi:protocatechuate 3,4-dioxygenase beta subunit